MDSEKSLNNILGTFIREYRRQKGLTHVQLAACVGLSIRHIGKLEVGTYSPKLFTYLKISNVLGFDIQDIKGVQGYTQNEQEVKILFLLKKMNKKELDLLYKFWKTLIEFRNRHTEEIEVAN